MTLHLDIGCFGAMQSALGGESVTIKMAAGSPYAGHDLVADPAALARRLQEMTPAQLSPWERNQIDIANPFLALSFLAVADPDLAMQVLSQWSRGDLNGGELRAYFLPTLLDIPAERLGDLAGLEKVLDYVARFPPSSHDLMDALRYLRDLFALQESLDPQRAGERREQIREIYVNRALVVLRDGKIRAQIDESEALQAQVFAAWLRAYEIEFEDRMEGPGQVPDDTRTLWELPTIAVQLFRPRNHGFNTYSRVIEGIEFLMSTFGFLDAFAQQSPNAAPASNEGNVAWTDPQFRDSVRETGELLNRLSNAIAENPTEEGVIFLLRLQIHDGYMVVDPR